MGTQRSAGDPAPNVRNFGAPSARELLERAAALGPRRTWESLLLGDPVLAEKQQPHVAARRAVLTRLVKAGLGACMGICLLACAVSAFAATEPAAPQALAHASHALVPVEALTSVRRAKAPHGAPNATARSQPNRKPSRAARGG
jgi:hypothetical protein